MPSRSAPEGHGWRKLILIAALTLTLSLGAGIAFGQTGGVTTPTSSGPQVDEVQCLKTCAGLRKAGEGSVIKLTGRRLGGVTRVTFKRANGGRVGVAPNNTSGRIVRARVPEGAKTGRVGARNAGGVTTSPQRLKIVSQGQLSDGGNFRLTEASAAPAKTYFMARKARRARIRYTFNGEGATAVRIEILSINKKRVVKRVVQRNRRPLTTYGFRWNGRTAAGRPAPDGRYRFRIGAAGNGQVESTPDARFKHYRHIFPVRSRQRGWGDGIGAGRGHQGQDIFSPCGSRLVAATGGRVRHVRYHSRAGHYVVIRGRATGRDYVYMHLRRRSRVSPGDTVRTGQVIGKVGATGNASGCHLHFELWSKPGWYRGGHVMRSVTKHMRRWASWS